MQRDAYTSLALRYGRGSDRHDPEASLPETFTHLDGSSVLSGHDRNDVGRGGVAGQLLGQIPEVLTPIFHLRQAVDDIFRPS